MTAKPLQPLSGSEERPRMVAEAVRQMQQNGVRGPRSSTDGNVALMDGATGRVLKDGGYVAARAGANTDITSVLLNQIGLQVKGGSANALTIKPNETMTAARTLNLIGHDADRTIDLSGNLTVSGTATIPAGTALVAANNLSDVSSAATARSNLGAEPAATLNGINTRTASYTLVLGDAGQLIETNVASANNLTIPPNSSVAFAINTRVDIVQYGAGQTTIVAGAGVTIRSKGGNLKITGQYSGASLYKRGTDEWVLVGDLTA